MQFEKRKALFDLTNDEIDVREMSSKRDTEMDADR